MREKNTYIKFVTYTQFIQNKLLLVKENFYKLSLY